MGNHTLCFVTVTDKLTHVLIHVPERSRRHRCTDASTRILLIFRRGVGGGGGGVREREREREREPHPRAQTP